MDTIPISELLEALDEITDDETEAVVILTLSRNKLSSRMFGEPHMVEEALIWASSSYPRSTVQ